MINQRTCGRTLLHVATNDLEAAGSPADCPLVPHGEAPKSQSEQVARQLAELTIESREIGLAILATDGIIDASVAGGYVRARVRSSRGRGSYLVSGNLANWIACTCSWGGACKHVGAVLAHLSRCDNQAARRVPSAAPLTALPSFVEDWLGRVGSVGGRAPPDVTFELSFDPSASVAVVPRHPRRDGNLGAPIPFTQHGLNELRRERALGASIARALDVTPWDNHGRYVPKGQRGAMVLSALLDSGALIFRAQGAIRGGGTGLPLRSGPSRTATLTWKRDGDLVRPHCDLGEPPAQVIPVVPAQYVDDATGVVGEIVAADPRLVADWLAGPILDEPKARLVAARLKESRTLPAPPVVHVEEVREIPTGFLRLFEQPSPYGPPVRRFAALSARYGVHEVPYGSPGDTARFALPDKRVIVHRNLPDEASLAARLVDWGFTRDVMYYSAEPNRFELPSELDWIMFLSTGVRELRAESFEIEIDGSLSVDVVEVDEWFASLEKRDNDWFDLDFGVEVGGERVSLGPLLVDAFRAHGTPRAGQAMPVRLPSGAFAVIPWERLEPLVETLIDLAAAGTRKAAGPLAVSRWRALDLALALRLEGETFTRLRTLRDALARASELPRVAAPKGLLAKLRPYQSAGTSWLSFLGKHDLGGVLADDMGLGKTLQVIALLLRLRQDDKTRPPALIVAPTSVMLSWIDQLAAFAPALTVQVWHGRERHVFSADLLSSHVVLTTYALLHRDRAELTAKTWDVVVLDEAQAVKNSKSVYADAARTLVARQRLALTGTPLENHLGELWSIVSFAVPGLLGDERGFRAAFRNPIERDGDRERLALLKRRVAPFMLRRVKEEVAKDLPPKTTVEHKIELGPAQRDLYEAVRHTMDTRVREEIARRGLAKSQIVVLDALLKLRQVCCDPRLLKVGAAKRRPPSAKLAAFEELVSTLVDEGRKILVFSQFVEMLDILRDVLAKKGCACAYLTGATTDRARVVESFQKGDAQVFLISLKAGGTGINLTAADTVIHYDPWWNPAVEAQATDRAHRIGQDKPVFVHRLITLGTVEETIVALQAKKAVLAKNLLEGGEGALKIDEALVDSLFAPLPGARRR